MKVNDSNACGTETLMLAEACRNAWEGFRRTRRRNKLYTFGDQWKDPITVGGIRMTEEEYILREGHLPLKNNLIRRLVRSVLGVFRDRLSSRNLSAGMAEVYSRSMEEFLISGLAVHKKIICGKGEVHTGIVSPEAFFLDPNARDPRGRDVTVIGQLHELPRGEFCAAFAVGPDSYRKLYDMTRTRPAVKVYEVWTRERRPRIIYHDKNNCRVIKTEERIGLGKPVFGAMAARWILDDVWRFRYVTADGVVLREGDSPLPHGSHPYVFKAYPFLDGEVHSFVSDIIDQQRYTNRLITLYDWVMRASAKGVLLFPKDALPDGEDIRAVTEQWGRFDGVIVYEPKVGQPVPQQVNSTGANTGIADLLSIQLKMMEDIAGVNGALQGRVENIATSGTLYKHQTENALTSLRDILDTFDSFVDEAEGFFRF